MSAAAKNTNRQKLVPVRELIVRHADELGMSNSELAQATGYKSPNVIAMIKSGSMPLPMNKIPQFAAALRIDPMFLAMSLDAEKDMGLSALLQAVSSRTPITLNEERLIQRMRKASNGLDIDFDDHAELFDELMGTFLKIAEREARMHQASVDRLTTPGSALEGGARRAAQKNKEASD